MRVSRRSILFTSVSAGIAAGVPTGYASGNASRKPNLILVMADDFGYECLSCNGSKQYKTPNLDSMASAGVRFTEAHSTPLCTPSRVQIMTGKYGFRNYTEFGALRPGERTFGHHLKDAGYQTCVVGKWQLQGSVPGTKQRGVGTSPDQAGFDEHCLWHVRARGSRYWDPLVQTNGATEKKLAGRYGPDVFLEYAEGFIRRNRERPFFLYYPLVLTHDPYVPAPSSGDTTAEEKSKDDTKWFGDMVEYTDTIVGRLLACIERNGIAGNTLVIFTGDNGTRLGVTSQTVDGPVTGAKGLTTAGGTHVPLIAKWPGKSASGATCRDLIDFTDVFPTLSEAAGVPMPKDHPLDGRSFLPQIEGKSGNPREWIFCHYAPKWGGRPHRRWVMDHRWKLYEDGAFHDLRQDPEEKNPLETIPPEAADVVERFKSVLGRMRNADGTTEAK